MRLNNRCVNVSFNLIGCVCLVLGVASCNGLVEKSEFEDHKFQIALMSENVSNRWNPLLVRQEISWLTLQKAFPDEIAYILTEDDIEIYDWSEQVVTITELASRNLGEFLECPEQYWTKDLIFLCMDFRAFVVALENEPVYGGIFSHDTTPSIIQQPVIFVSLFDEKMVFSIRPSVGIPEEEITIIEPYWYGIKSEKIRDLFRNLGKLID